MTQNPRFHEPDPGLFSGEQPDQLKAKCLLCKHAIPNAAAAFCPFFEHKPDNIYLKFETCPHFERCDDKEGLRRIEANIGDYDVYIPRDDDTPPEGWEAINENYHGPNWREKPEQIKEMMRREEEEALKERRHLRRG